MRSWESKGTGKVYCKVCEKWWRNDKWAWLGWFVHSWVKVTQGKREI